MHFQYWFGLCPLTLSGTQLPQFKERLIHYLIHVPVYSLLHLYDFILCLTACWNWNVLCIAADSGLSVRSEVLMVVVCQGMCFWDLVVVLWLTNTHDWEEHAVSVFISALKMETHVPKKLLVHVSSWQIMADLFCVWIFWFSGIWCCCIIGWIVPDVLRQPIPSKLWAEPIWQYSVTLQKTGSWILPLWKPQNSFCVLFKCNLWIKAFDC